MVIRTSSSVEDSVEVAVAEHDRALPVPLPARGETLHLRQRLRRDEDLTAGLDGLHAREIPKREPVGVRGDQAEPALGGHHEHAGELWRPRIVDERCPDDLAEAVGEDATRDLDSLLLRHAEPGDLGTDGDPDHELGPTGGEAHILVVAATATAPGSNERTMSTTSREGTSTEPSVSPAT